MRQIARLIDKVLRASKPGTTKSGKVSKANVVIDEGVKSQVISEVKTLLGDFVLYPELDLDLMKRVYQ